MYLVAKAPGKKGVEPRSRPTVFKHDIVELDSRTMGNKDWEVLRPRAFQYAMSVAFGKILLHPVDGSHNTFLDQDRSDELVRIRPGLPQVLECTYIVDLASVVSICRCAGDTSKAGEEPLRKRVERVAGCLLDDHAFTGGRLKAEEVFHRSKIGCLYILSKNALPYGSFVQNGNSSLEGILLHLLMVPTASATSAGILFLQERKPPYRT
jgi:hypothetical protein